MRAQKSHRPRKSRRTKSFRRLTTFERGLSRAPLSLVPGSYYSLPSFERLEDRSLLSANPLVVDLSADTQADSILVNLDASGANLQVTVNGSQVQYVPLASVSQLSVLGSSQNDTLTVDSTNGDPIPSGGLDFNGDEGGLQPGENNTLVLQGGSYTNESFTPLTQHSGTITLDSSTISYEALTPIIDTTPADTLTVSGTNGNDAISYGPGVHDFVDDGLVSVNNSETIEFANKTNLVLDGLSGNDTFNLNCQITPAGLDSIAVNGDSTSSDTLIVNGSSTADNITVLPLGLQSADITGAGPVQIDAAAIDNLVVDGQGGADVLTYESYGAATQLTFVPGATANSGTIDGQYSTTSGGSGGLLVPVGYTNVDAAGGSLSFTHTGGGRTDELTVEGTSKNDTFAAGSDGVALYQSDATSQTREALPILTPAITSLTLAGLAGDDTFKLFGASPAALPYTTFIDGSGATDPPTVNLTTDGTATTANLGAGQYSATEATVTGGGLGKVTMSGVGVVNVIDGANFQGTGGMTVTGQPVTPENFVVTPVANGAEIQDMNPNPVFNLGPTLNYSGAGAVTVAGDGPPVDGDTLTIDATGDAGGVSQATVTSTQVTVNGDTHINYTAADLTSLYVNGLNGTNSLIVDSFNGPVTTPIYYDGGNALNNHVILQGNKALSASYLPSIDAGTRAVTVTYPTASENVYSKNFAYIQDNVPADDLYLLDYAAASTIKYTTVAGLGGLIQPDNDPGIFFQNQSSVYLKLSGEGTVDLDNSSVVPDGLQNIYVQADVPRSALNVVLNVLAPSGSNINYQPTSSTDATISGAGAVPITASSIAQVNIDGGQSADTITYTSPAGANNQLTFVPGATVNSGEIDGASNGAPLLPLSYTNVDVSGSLTFRNGGDVRSDWLTFEGTPGKDTFNVQATFVQLGQSATPTMYTQTSLTARTPGIANLTLAGLGGDDTFQLVGALPYTGTFIHGSGASDPPTASLFTDGTTATTVNLGAGESSAIEATVTGGGLGTVTVSGVGVVNVFDGANAKGTGGVTVTGQQTTPENFVVTPGVDTAEIQDMNPNPVFNLGPTLNYSGAGAVTVAGDGPPVDGDTLTINSNAVPDDVGSSNVTVTNTQVLANGDTPVNYTAANLAGLQINGLQQYNILYVDSTNGGIYVPIHFDGGTNGLVFVQGGTARSDNYFPGPSRGQGLLSLFIGTNYEQVYFTDTENGVADDVPSGGLTVYGTASNDRISYLSAIAQVNVNDLPPVSFEQKSQLTIVGEGDGDNISLDTCVLPARVCELSLSRG